MFGLKKLLEKRKQNRLEEELRNKKWRREYINNFKGQRCESWSYTKNDCIENKYILCIDNYFRGDRFTLDEIKEITESLNVCYIVKQRDIPPYKKYFSSEKTNLQRKIRFIK